MSSSFKGSLRMGEIGEIIFHEAHCRDVVKLSGFKSDFEYKDTGERIELKTDFYDMNKTENFFLERWSDVEQGKPGGPWQSQTHGSDYFVYFFVKNMTYFRFRTDELVDALEPIIAKLEPVHVQNRTYTTVGYRVPRILLTELAEEVKLTASIKPPEPAA